MQARILFLTTLLLLFGGQVFGGEKCDRLKSTSADKTSFDNMRNTLIKPTGLPSTIMRLQETVSYLDKLKGVFSSAKKPDQPLNLDPKMIDDMDRKITSEYIRVNASLTQRQAELNDYKDKTCEFPKTYTLTLKKGSGISSYTCKLNNSPYDCSGGTVRSPESGQLTLTANLASGYQWNMWTGDYSGMCNQYNVSAKTQNSQPSCSGIVISRDNITIQGEAKMAPVAAVAVPDKSCTLSPSPAVMSSTADSRAACASLCGFALGKMCQSEDWKAKAKAGFFKCTWSKTDVISLTLPGSCSAASVQAASNPPAAVAPPSTSIATAKCSMFVNGKSIMESSAPGMAESMCLRNCQVEKPNATNNKNYAPIGIAREYVCKFNDKGILRERLKTGVACGAILSPNIVMRLTDYEKGKEGCISDCQQKESELLNQGKSGDFICQLNDILYSKKLVVIKECERRELLVGGATGNGWKGQLDESACKQQQMGAVKCPSGANQGASAVSVVKLTWGGAELVKIACPVTATAIAGAPPAKPVAVAQQVVAPIATPTPPSKVCVVTYGSLKAGAISPVTGSMSSGVPVPEQSCLPATYRYRACVASATGIADLGYQVTWGGVNVGLPISCK